MNSSTATETQQYRSAVDPWLAVLLALLPLIAVATVVVAILNDGEGIGAAVFSLLIIAAIYGGLLYPLYYRLEDTALLVRFGFIRQHISYADITAVQPSRNPLSSPALSLRRLKVSYRGHYALISPVRRDEFLSALAQRAGLERDGDRLRRPA
jgi:hypothetical protein